MKKICLLGLLLGMFVVFGVDTIKADSNIMNNGVFNFSGENTEGCIHYTSSLILNWRSVDTSNTFIYSWTQNGNYKIYDTCNNSLKDFGGVNGFGRQVIVHDQEIVVRSFGRTTSGGHTIVSNLTIVHGELKSQQIWFDGKRLI